MVKERLTFVYQADRCIGCKACQSACKTKNHLETGVFFRRVEVWNEAPGDKKRLVHFSGACNHCADAVCIDNCPTGAMYRAEDGAVRIESGLCMACGSCAAVCPYGAPAISFAKGVSQKCDLCPDMIEKGREPACVSACPVYALQLTRYREEEPGTVTDPAEYKDKLPERSITDPAYYICDMNSREKVRL